MKNYFIAGCLILNLSWLPSATATSVLPLNLEQLSTRASHIFFAEVVSNQTKKDEQSGYIATFTEFKIIDSIKGFTERTLTIKQIGGYDPASKIRLYIHGIPTFQTGNNYVVFLPKASKLGFSSPLGLYQGSYTVTTINGEQIVSNGKNLTESPSTIDNNIVQVPLAISADKPSQSRLVDFINTIRAYNTH
ncbi:MAG: hypothetical protein KAJ32_10305 [Gammaproteobacteria bacterium]|nr:hypothetical protein [Gammaproteobacteria bacterium]